VLSHEWDNGWGGLVVLECDQPPGHRGVELAHGFLLTAPGLHHDPHGIVWMDCGRDHPHCS
jgi:hypothetical protein